MTSELDLVGVRVWEITCEEAGLFAGLVKHVASLGEQLNEDLLAKCGNGERKDLELSKNHAWMAGFSGDQKVA